MKLVYGVIILYHGSAVIKNDKMGSTLNPLAWIWTFCLQSQGSSPNEPLAQELTVETFENTVEQTVENETLHSKQTLRHHCWVVQLKGVI